MRTLLVTGGAGFIGGNFVHLLMAETDCQVVNLDKLTYAGQPRLPGRPGRQPAPRLRPGRHRRPRPGAPPAARARGRTRWSTSPPRATWTAPSTAPRSSSRPTSSAPSTCWRRPRLLVRARQPSARQRFRFLHVSTDEVYGSLGATGRFTEDHALRAELALLGLQGGLRSPGAGLVTTPTVCRR